MQNLTGVEDNGRVAIVHEVTLKRTAGKLLCEQPIATRLSKLTIPGAIEIVRALIKRFKAISSRLNVGGKPAILDGITRGEAVSSAIVSSSQ
jgi:hypothetical protein